MGVPGERAQLRASFRLLEMGERNAALGPEACSRDEQQVVQIPGGLVRPSAALLAHQRPQDSPHDHHRQALRLEVDPENTPGQVQERGVQRVADKMINSFGDKPSSRFEFIGWFSDRMEQKNSLNDGD